MAVLHNRVSQKELKQLLMEETEPRTTISFYHYHIIQNPQEFRDALYKGLDALNVFGRVYVAKEGINAQVSVPSTNYEAFRSFLYLYDFLNGIRLNIAVDDDGKSFWVLKIKVRDKIVADGIADPLFSMENKGRYVNALEMNEFLKDPDTVVVDMLQDQKEKNIIMYCTGGIRCEKASAYMLHNGFKNVFHLEGGIINYAQQIKKEGLPSAFKGKNFVFDDRLGERITDEIISRCHQCGQPADTHTNCKNDACHLLFIQCEKCAQEFDGCCTPECQQVYQLPLDEQQKLREGRQNGIMIFHKSQKRLRPTIEEMKGYRGEK